MTAVFGLTVEPTHGANLAALFSPLLGNDKKYTLVTSFTEPLEGLAASVLDDGGWNRILDSQYICEPLVRSLTPAWPTTAERALAIMESVPPVFNGWVLRNLLWQTACGGFIYWITEDSIGTQDVAVHLTAARILRQRTIGVMPSELRAMIESTQLTLTDVIVGEADTRTLSLLLESLNKEQEGG